MSSRAESTRLTRESLAAAARELIGDQGFRDTTIEQIAERAGVSPRTFFRHFPTKEAALFSRVEDIVALLDAELSQVPDDLPLVTALRAVMGTVARSLQADGTWMVKVARLADDVPEIRQHLDFHVGYRLRGVVVAWAERHLGVPAVADPRPGLAAGIIVACADTARERWLAYGGRGSLPALVEESFDALGALMAADDRLAPREGSDPPTADPPG
jgi:AcrR family transcriptional regulator